MKLNPAICQHFLIFFLLFLQISQPRQNTRLCRFEIIENDSIEIEQFTIAQFGYVSKIHCTQLCFRILNCLSFTFVAKKCMLFSYDLRIKIKTISKNEISAKKSFLYGMSQANGKMSCFVDQSEVSNRDSIGEKCELGEKIIDSNCSEWSVWRAHYDDEVCVGTKLFSLVTRTRTCTRGLNGGMSCSGNIFEEKQKIPVLFRSDGIRRNYALAGQFCRDHQLLLFTNIALTVAQESQFVSPANLTKLRNWYYFIDAMNTVDDKFQINSVGLADEFFNYCLPLDLFTGWADEKIFD